jgi:hypothetical protein
MMTCIVSLLLCFVFPFDGHVCHASHVRRFTLTHTHTHTHMRARARADARQPEALDLANEGRRYRHDCRSDIWALAITALALRLRRFPYQGESILAIGLKMKDGALLAVGSVSEPVSRADGQNV